MTNHSKIEFGYRLDFFYVSSSKKRALTEVPRTPQSKVTALSDENAILIHGVSLQSLIGVGMRAIAQNGRNTIHLKWVKKYPNFPSKNSKIDFLAPKRSGMTNKNEKFSKFFFGRNRFRMVQMYF